MTVMFPRGGRAVPPGPGARLSSFFGSPPGSQVFFFFQGTRDRRETRLVVQSDTEAFSRGERVKTMNAIVRGSVGAVTDGVGYHFAWFYMGAETKAGGRIAEAYYKAPFMNEAALIHTGRLVSDLSARIMADVVRLYVEDAAPLFSAHLPGRFANYRGNIFTLRNVRVGITLRFTEKEELHEVRPFDPRRRTAYRGRIPAVSARPRRTAASATRAGSPRSTR